MDLELKVTVSARYANIKQKNLISVKQLFHEAAKDYTTEKSNSLSILTERSGYFAFLTNLNYAPYTIQTNNFQLPVSMVEEWDIIIFTAHLIFYGTHVVSQVRLITLQMVVGDQIAINLHMETDIVSLITLSLFIFLAQLEVNLFHRFSLTIRNYSCYFGQL